MDFKSKFDNLEKIAKRFDLTEDENEAIELAARSLHFIEMQFLKPWFKVYLAEMEKDLTDEEQEYIDLVTNNESTNEEKKAMKEKNLILVNETKQYIKGLNELFKKRFK